MVALEQHAEGLILPVRAYPAARKNAITGEHDRSLKVSVAQAPEKGKANKAIISVLCDGLGLKKSQIELISGETTSQKRFLVRNVSSKTLHERINVLVVRNKA